MPVGWLAPLVAAQHPAEPQTINVPAVTNKAVRPPLDTAASGAGKAM